jgi:biopolymer transport protein ExbB/TolQ
MSIASLAVILNRLFAFRGTHLDPAFVEQVSREVRRGSPEEAMRLCARHPQPLAQVCAAIIRQGGNREAGERAMDHILHAEAQRLEAYVPLLATIASSAPFIGLFGTVVGIIRAFSDISTHMEAGPSVVAAGIAEALVSTAAGLLVAIPALVAYNYFVRRTERLVDTIDVAAFDLLESRPVPNRPS